MGWLNYLKRRSQAAAPNGRGSPAGRRPPGLPRYIWWWFLGALAFSEIEQGLLDVGRAHVEMSLRGNSRNANAAHVSAHGYYESGDVSDGIRFLRDWLKAYSVGSPLHCHLHWHLALWALQNGNLDDAWSIYHASLRPGVCIGPQINRLTDSASFLFRAELAGEPSDDTGVDGPPEGFDPPDLPAEPQLTAPLGPDIDAEMFKDVAKKLFG